MQVFVKLSSELNKYKPLVDKLYDALKNNSGKMENYIEIKKLINYFKGALVNVMSNID